MNKAFISEASKGETTGVPAIQLANKIGKEEKKINSDGVKKMGGDTKNYEEDIKLNAADQKEMPQNKFNYVNDEEKEYHEEMEIMNGQEMVQYDGEPSSDYKKRAEEAIAGSSRMGNNPEWANVVAKGQGGDPEFGKNLVKKIKASAKKRSQQTPTSKMFGDDWEVTKDQGHKPYAIEEAGKPRSLMADRNYTHFAIYKPTKQIVECWNYKGIDNEELKSERKHYFFNDIQEKLSHVEPKIKNTDISIVTRKKLDALGIDPEKPESWYSSGSQQATPAAEPSPEVPADNNDKNTPQIKETMKRLRFKKEFNGIGNALKLIPESYREDKKTFEMTDGNETYKIRWEGSLTEGRAVVITAADKNMINEDIQKMKHLFNYKSATTLGTLKGKDRISENTSFEDIWKKTKALLETEDIDGQDAEKEAPFEEAQTKHASEAKKHVQGSVPTDKKTEAKKPKVAPFEEAGTTHAPEAKKHVEGSVKTEKKSQVKNPKEAPFEEANVGVAPEATKDIKEKK